MIKTFIYFFHLNVNACNTLVRYSPSKLTLHAQKWRVYTSKWLYPDEHTKVESRLKKEKSIRNLQSHQVGYFGGNIPLLYRGHPQSFKVCNLNPLQSYFSPLPLIFQILTWSSERVPTWTTMIFPFSCRNHLKPLPKGTRLHPTETSPTTFFFFF